MIKHHLKADPIPFQAVADGRKPYELRLDDRSYRVGDALILHETQHTGEEMRGGAPLIYTGRVERRTIAHILKGAYGLKDEYCIMAFDPK